MSAYVGELRLVGFSFAPVGWQNCDGSILPISQNDALFALIGTTYGGDGQTTFALPDLRSRAPVHVGSSTALGQMGGTEESNLTLTQIPTHNHTAGASSANGTSDNPAGLV